MAVTNLFRLVSAGGDTLGSLESAVPDWQAGDTVAVADDPLHGVLEVEPL